VIEDVVAFLGTWSWKIKATDTESWRQRTVDWLWLRQAVDGQTNSWIDRYKRDTAYIYIDI
jgi:hypothetical protein